jgi:hypothetical protein
MNIKDLQNNEDLMNNLVDDIDEIPEDSEVSYEVWAIGYDANKNITDAEMLIGEFNNPDEAVEKAKTISLADILHQAAEEHDGSEPIDDVAYISVEVETTVANEADDEIFNIGTIYQRELWIDGEYGSEENVDNHDFDDFEDDVEDPEIVYIVNRSDYEILEDNTLKVSCDLLKGYNKNDTVFICLPHEDNDFVLTYKIMSRVMYEDGDYYHCELDY